MIVICLEGGFKKCTIRHQNQHLRPAITDFLSGSRLLIFQLQLKSHDPDRHWPPRTWDETIVCVNPNTFVDEFSGLLI